MQGQITTPFSSPHVVPTEPSSKARSAAHLCVNKKKIAASELHAGDRTHDPIVNKFFPHHYTAHWFVNMLGVAFIYTM